jgi:hypothetical protein
MDPVVGAQYRWSAAFAPSAPEFWGLFQGEWFERREPKEKKNKMTRS